MESKGGFKGHLRQRNVEFVIESLLHIQSHFSNTLLTHAISQKSLKIPPYSISTHPFMFPPSCCMHLARSARFIEIIILIMRNNTEQPRNDSYLTIESPPQREQWAIINKYKALEFERMRAKEREIDRMKKQSFRRELDNQLNSRTNAELKQKEDDKLYCQKLNEKAETMKQREELEKFERFMKRKLFDQQNIQKIEANRSSRINDFDTGYHLDIGMQSDREHKEKTQQFKKEMMDTLDLQLKEKSEEAKKNRLKNQQIEELHKQMQENYFKPAEKKLYSQNQRIYEYYNQLQHERMMKEKELEQKMIDQVNQRTLRAQNQRARMQQAKKMMDKEKVKQMLDSQVRQLSIKRTIQNKVNPEELSYEFISSMFRPKEQTFNKQLYKQELRKQAEEQRMRKQLQNHMSEEQYRINMNQLNKAVAGSYAQNNYLDRSMGAIGDHKKFQLDNMQYDLKDKDAEVIKKRLQALRGKGIISMAQSRQS